MPPHPLDMVDAAGWCMKAALFAMLALIIIFFHNRFGKLPPLPAFIEFIQLVFCNQLFDPFFQCVLCHIYSPLSLCWARLPHPAEGKYKAYNENKKGTQTTLNYNCVVCVPSIFAICLIYGFILTYPRTICNFLFLPQRGALWRVLLPFLRPVLPCCQRRFICCRLLPSAPM